MTGQPCGVAVLGAGSIAAPYIQSIHERGWGDVRAVVNRSGTVPAGLGPAGITHITPLEEALADPAVELVLNLTPAREHERATAQCLAAGKHVYSEKPLGVTADGARALRDAAERADLMLACAPATVLGAAVQAAKAAMNAEGFGRIVGARGVLAYPGPELFHSNPDHLYAEGAGPMLDMGVYYLANFVFLLGPVASVFARVHTHRAERVIHVGPRAGERFPVKEPTHWNLVLTHANGVVSTLTISFDGFGVKTQGIDIMGEGAALALGAPTLGEAALARSTTVREWEEMDAELLAPDAPDDFACGPRVSWEEFTSSRPLSLSAAQAIHHLDIVEAAHRSAREDRIVPVLRLDGHGHGGQAMHASTCI